MRWKGLFLIIVLSAILSNYYVQSSETDVDEYDEYDEQAETHIEDVKEPPVTSVETKAPPVISIAPNTTLMRASAVVGERSGKYLDYPYMSNYDLNDQNYDWNGE